MIWIIERLGPAFILDAPIASSTALTVLTIPAVYVWLRDDRRGYGEGFTGSL